MKKDRRFCFNKMTIVFCILFLMLFNSVSIFAGGKAESGNAGKNSSELSGKDGITVADPKGVKGSVPYQFELGEFEKLAKSKLTFRENPDINELNKLIAGNGELKSVSERLPEEPLIIMPWERIGEYGGTIRGISKASESGTGDILSLRHVTLFKLHDDYQTVLPNLAKSYKWNDNFTELTIVLRKGHKWSDGEPFTAEDIEFWYNDLILNREIYNTPPSRWTSSGKPWSVKTLDETTVQFIFPESTPGALTTMAIEYAQPFQPKHFYKKYHIKYNPDAGKIAKENGFNNWADLVNEFYGGSDWKDVASPLLKGSFDFVAPTLESHILVKETPEGRTLVANPYFHAVDTDGNQLPYISKIEETYVSDLEVQKLKVANGEVDYKMQSLLLEDFPMFKENEKNGNYQVDLVVAPAANQWYAFNTTVKDPALRKIFNDVRFRRAMSLAINRDEINEIIYLGQCVPEQWAPFDPNTTSVLTDKHLNAYSEFDPKAANKLLDEMGLKDINNDGYREQADGKMFSILFQYSTQATSPKMHELIRDYWKNVGVRIELKEVSTEKYRELGSSNDLEISSWSGSTNASYHIVANPVIFYPPFGGILTPGTGFAWGTWLKSGGKEGIEPPEDAKKLVELAKKFSMYELGTDESNKIGKEIADIHAKNLWKTGTVGRQVAPVVHKNGLKNFQPFTVNSSTYFAYAFRPCQWYLAK